MGETLKPDESQDRGEAEQASHSEVLAKLLQRRRFQTMDRGIPNIAHQVDIQVGDSETEEPHPETWAFNGALLARRNVKDYDPRGAVYVRVILGIGGELIELRTLASDPHQYTQWAYVSEAKLAERTDVAMAVLAGFNRLLAAGSVEERLESAAQFGDSPPNIRLLEAYRGDPEGPSDDEPA